MLTVLVIVIDGIWDVWYVSWKCECLDGWICEASLWRWERSLSEKSCYTNIPHHSKGKLALIVRLPHLCFMLLYVLHFSVFFYSLQEAERSKREKGNHSEWRNYDDLNEYFWYWFFYYIFVSSLDFISLLNCRSADCFRLGWPMRADADFFYQPSNLADERNEVSWPVFLF